VTASFEQMISKGLITLDLQGKDKDSVIEELAELMDRENKLYSKSDFIKAVHEREALTSTAVGWGVAIPHARSAAVKETAVSFGRSKGFRWDPDSEEPIRLVFLLAVPSANPNKDYIDLLASLARMLVDADFRNALAKAQTRDEVIMIISKASAARQDQLHTAERPLSR